MRFGIVGLSVMMLAPACERVADPYVAGDGISTPRLRRVAPLEEVGLIPVERIWFVTPETWVGPARISVAEGRIAVVDPPINQVHVVRLTDGSPLSSVGREGRGPGEWIGLRSAVLVGNQLVVSHSSSTSLFVHELAGGLVNTIELGRTSLQLIHGARGVVISRGTGASAPEFSRIDMAAGNRVSTIDPGQSSYAEEQYGECREHTAVSDGVLRMSCAAGRFELIRDNGATTRWLEWSDEPITASEAELDAYVKRFWALRGRGRALTPLVQRQLDALRVRAEIKERYPLLRTDVSTGRLLVVEQAFGEYAGQPGILHLLSADGRHVGRIETGVVIQDAAIYEDSLILLVRDLATDALGLGLWRMQLPS